MDVLLENTSEDLVKKVRSSTSSEKSADTSAEVPKRSSKRVKPSQGTAISRTPGVVSSTKKQNEHPGPIDNGRSKTTLTKTSVNSSAASLQRRNSTGGVEPKQPSSAPKRQENGTGGERIAPSVSDHGKRINIDNRRSSLPSVSSKAPSTTSRRQTLKSSPLSRLSSTSESPKADLQRKSSTKPSVSSFKTVTSASVDELNSLNSKKRAASNTSLSARSSLTTRSFKLRSMSSSVDKGSSLSGRKKTSAPENRECRFMMLPLVDIKAGNESVKC